MLKKHMAACLLASAFVTAPVLAQTSTSPGATTGGSPPAATAPSAGAASGAGATSGASGHFVTQQQQTQWRASRLIGINVYGANNERIGDVNEVLVDRQGNADAVVVGVGGFLGIGEKNVALPFNAFEWVMEDTRRTAAAPGTASPGATGTAGSAGMGTAGTGGAARTDAAGTTASTTAAGGTVGTGTAAGTGTAPGAGASRSSADRGYPDHAVLRMSKADLENAPTFRYVGDTSSDRARDSAPRSTTGGAGTTGTGGGAAGGAPAPAR